MTFTLQNRADRNQACTQQAGQHKSKNEKSSSYIEESRKGPEPIEQSRAEQEGAYPTEKSRIAPASI